MDKILLNTLLPMSVAGGFAWLLLRLLRPVFGKLSALWCKVFLITCAAMFLLPWPLFLPKTTINLSAKQLLSAAPAYSAGKMLASLQQKTGQEATQMANLPKQAPKKPAQVNWPILAANVYAAGFLVQVAAAFGLYARLNFCIKSRCTKVQDETIVAIYQDICRQMEIKNLPALYMGKEICSPILAGALQAYIVLPKEKMPQNQLKFAMQHELYHHKKQDLKIKYLLIFASALHWYNPAAHFLCKDFEEICELSCDEAVGKGLALSQRKEYATMLLDFAEKQGCAMAFSLASPAKRLQKRLLKIMRPAKPKRFFKIAATATTALFLALAFFTGCSMASGAANHAQSTGAGTVPPDMQKSTAASLASASEKAQTKSALALPQSQTADNLPQNPGQSAQDDLQQSPQMAELKKTTLYNPVPTASGISRAFVQDGHRGADFIANAGENILAVADGTVLTSGWHDSYGNYVVIDHGNFQSLYAHNQENLVQMAQSVKAGEVIALIGQTGNSISRHCHVEISQDGKLLDPLQYINLKLP